MDRYQQQQQQHQAYYQQQQADHQQQHLVPQVSYYNTQSHHYQHQQQQNYNNYDQQQQASWHNQNYYNQPNTQQPTPSPGVNPVVGGGSGSSFQSYFPQQVHQHHQQQQQHEQQSLHSRPLSVPPPTQSPLQQHSIDSSSVSSSSVENNHHNNQIGPGPAPITNLARFVDTQQGQTGFIQHHHFQQQQQPQQPPQTFIPPAVSSPSIISLQNHSNSNNQPNSNHNNINNNPTIPTPPSSVSSSGSASISQGQTLVGVQSKPNIPVSAFVASVVATKSLPPSVPLPTTNSNQQQQQQQQHLQKQQPSQINVNLSKTSPSLIPLKSPGGLEVTNGFTTNGTSSSNIINKPPNVGVARTKASMRKLLMEQLEETQPTPGEKTTTTTPSTTPNKMLEAAGSSAKKNSKDNKDSTTTPGGSSTSSTPTKSGRGGGRSKAEEKQDEEEAARILLELQKDPVSTKRQRRKSSNPPTATAAASKNPPEGNVDEKEKEKRTSTRKQREKSSEKVENNTKTTPRSAKLKSKQQEKESPATTISTSTPTRVGKRKRKIEEEQEEVDDEIDPEIIDDSDGKKERKKRKYTYKKKIIDRPPGLPKYDRNELGRPPKNPTDPDTDVPIIEGKRNSNLRKRESTKISSATKKEKPQKIKIEKIEKIEKVKKGPNKKVKLSLEVEEVEKSTGKIARKSKVDQKILDSGSAFVDEKEKISTLETAVVGVENDDSVLKNSTSTSTDKDKHKSKGRKGPRPKLTQEELNAVRRANLQKAKIAIALRMKQQEEKNREIRERKAAAAAALIENQKNQKIVTISTSKKVKLDTNSILPPLDLTKVPESALKLEEGEIITNASRISLSPIIASGSASGTKTKSPKMSKTKKMTDLDGDFEEGRTKKKSKISKKDQQVIKIIETKPSEPPRIPQGPQGVDQGGHGVGQDGPGEDLNALANEPETEEKITLFYEVSQGNQSTATSTGGPIISQGQKIDEIDDKLIQTSTGNKKKSPGPKKDPKEKEPSVKKAPVKKEKIIQQDGLSANSLRAYEDSVIKVRAAIKKQRKELLEKKKLEKLAEAGESGIPIKNPAKRGPKKKQNNDQELVDSKKEIQILDIEQNLVASSKSSEISPRKLKEKDSGKEKDNSGKVKVVKTPKTIKDKPKKGPKIGKKALEMTIDGEIIQSYDEKPRDFGDLPNIINNEHVELNLKYPEINIIPIPRTQTSTTPTTTTGSTGEVVLGKKSSPKVKTTPKSKAIKGNLVNLESPNRDLESRDLSQSPSILSASVSVEIPSTSTSKSMLVSTPKSKSMLVSTPKSMLNSAKSAGSGSKPRPKKPSKATGKMIKAPLTLESREQQAGAASGAVSVKNNVNNVNVNYSLFPRDVHLQDNKTKDKTKSPTVTAYGPPLLTTKTGSPEGSGNQKSKKIKPSGPSVKMVNGKSKFKYNGESEYPVDEIKKAEEKLPREKPPQNEFDDSPWICCFCSKGPHVQRLGDLFGPYYVETKLKVGKKLVSEGDSKEKWVHEYCAIWAGGVVLIENSLKGLEAAIEHSKKTDCTVCKSKGATIGCLKRKCTNAAHFPCAKDDKWKLNFDTFHSFCSAH